MIIEILTDEEITSIEDFLSMTAEPTEYKEIEDDEFLADVTYFETMCDEFYKINQIN